MDAALREFRVDAVTEGQDALGEVSVVVEVEGQTGAGQASPPTSSSGRAGLCAGAVDRAVRALEGERGVGLPSPQRSHGP